MWCVSGVQTQKRGYFKIPSFRLFSRQGDEKVRRAFSVSVVISVHKKPFREGFPNAWDAPGKSESSQRSAEPKCKSGHVLIALKLIHSTLYTIIHWGEKQIGSFRAVIGLIIEQYKQLAFVLHLARLVLAKETLHIHPPESALHSNHSACIV